MLSHAKKSNLRSIYSAREKAPTLVDGSQLKKGPLRCLEDAHTIAVAGSVVNARSGNDLYKYASGPMVAGSGATPCCATRAPGRSLTCSGYFKRRPSWHGGRSNRCSTHLRKRPQAADVGVLPQGPAFDLLRELSTRQPAPASVPVPLSPHPVRDPTMKLIECEWCSSPAAAEVCAQWTLFDFDEAYACDTHVPYAENRFRRRLVDGQPPVDLWVTWWDVGAHYFSVPSPSS